MKIFSLFALPRKDELSILRKGLLFRILFVAAATIMEHDHDGLKPVWWYLVAALVGYIIIMATVISDRLGEEN